MQVVILAAGRGERFQQQGVLMPKPLLSANNKRLITHALLQAAEVSARPIVVCPEFLVSDLKCHVPMNVFPTFVPVRHTQQGAAMSLLTAAGMLDDDKPIMVTDCDTLFAQGVLRRFRAFVDRAFNKCSPPWESALLCFRPLDDSARYSFVRFERAHAEYPCVGAVAEKVRISSKASCGVHAFASWALARQAIYEMVILRSLVKNEYYLAPAHNNIQRKTAMFINPNDFKHVGTPEELQEYEVQTTH